MRDRHWPVSKETAHSACHIGSSDIDEERRPEAVLDQCRIGRMPARNRNLTVGI